MCVLAAKELIHASVAGGLRPPAVGGLYDSQMQDESRRLLYQGWPPLPNEPQLLQFKGP